MLTDHSIMDVDVLFVGDTILWGSALELSGFFGGGESLDSTQKIVDAMASKRAAPARTSGGPSSWGCKLPPEVPSLSSSALITVFSDMGVFLDFFFVAAANVSELGAPASSVASESAALRFLGVVLVSLALPVWSFGVAVEASRAACGEMSCAFIKRS